MKRKLLTVVVGLMVAILLVPIVASTAAAQTTSPGDAFLKAVDWIKAQETASQHAFYEALGGLALIDAYQLTGDTDYLDKAEDIGDRISSEGYYNIEDNPEHSSWVNHQASVIWFLAELYKLTNNMAYLSEAESVAGSAISEGGTYQSWDYNVGGWYAAGKWYQRDSIGYHNMHREGIMTVALDTLDEASENDYSFYTDTTAVWLARAQFPQALDNYIWARHTVPIYPSSPAYDEENWAGALAVTMWTYGDYPGDPRVLLDPPEIVGWGESNPFSGLQRNGLSAVALRAHGYVAEADAYVGWLVNQLEPYNEAQGYGEGSYGKNVRACALNLMALIDGKAPQDEIDKAVEWLISKQGEDGSFEGGYKHTAWAALALYKALPTPAQVNIQPDTLNLKSKGVFTAFITLPEGCDVADIDIGTVECQGATAIRGMIDSDTLIAKFNRQDLVGVATGDEITLTVTGNLLGGSAFAGSDTIRVISKGK